MKKILYYTDLMPFLTDSSKAISKVRKNFEIFNENRDKIGLVWHPYSRTEEFLELNKSDCIEEYRRLKEEYRERNLGELDEDSDGHNLAESCDAYYGDYSDITYFFTESNKPVMIQNFDVQ